MNPLWVHLDIQGVWIIQRVTLPSGDVRPPNIQTHLPAHFPKSYCTFLGKNNKNLWVCLCVCKHRMSSWGNQEQHKHKGKLLCHHQHLELKRIKSGAISLDCARNYVRFIVHNDSTACLKTSRALSHKKEYIFSFILLQRIKKKKKKCILIYMYKNKIK